MAGYGEGTLGRGPYGIGSDYSEYVDETLLDRFPDILPRDETSIFRQYIDAHEEEVTVIDNEITDVIESHQIDNADGDELDRIGALFGQIGERGDRNDQEYRNFLKSIVQSFKGRGTKPGIRFAVAAGLSTDPDNVVIHEHYDTLENSLEVRRWGDHSTQTMKDMFELAKPSVVQLRGTLIYATRDAHAHVSSDGARTGRMSQGLGAGTIGDGSIGDYS